MPYDMHVTIPDELGHRLEAEAARAHVSLNELVAQRLGHAIQGQATEKPRRPYASYFGVGKGMPGSHGSVAEIDRYIQEMRDEWDN